MGSGTVPGYPDSQPDNAGRESRRAVAQRPLPGIHWRRTCYWLRSNDLAPL